MDRPSTNGDNGRDGGGRFTRGNAGGPGNPYARRVARLRTLMLETVSDEDLKAIVSALVKQAKAGDLAAIREVLNRVTGRAGFIEHADPDSVDLHESDLRERRETIQSVEQLTQGFAQLIRESASRQG